MRFVARQTLLDHEIVVVRNVRRYALYTGYLNTFAYAGVNPHRAQRFDVVAIDACTHQVAPAARCARASRVDARASRQHFSRANNERDLLKFHLACVGARTRALSTGIWGCGIFGGVDSHKFVQQCLAAAVSDTKLYFSAGGARGARLRALFERIVDVDVGELFRIVLRYQRGERSFDEFLVDQLAQQQH